MNKNSKSQRNVTTIVLQRHKPNYTERIVRALARTGWQAIAVPPNGKLNPNRQLVEFCTPVARLKVRFSIFAVGDRGESHRRDERRIQITTTYLSGLKREPGFKDIVLGYDSENDVYVGLDARRLEFGGKKHNASSSVDSKALEISTAKSITIRPHETQILGLEYQAIFTFERLAEYVFNADLIHRGLYVGNGWFSDYTKRTVAVLTAQSANGREELLILGMPRILRHKQKIKSTWIDAYQNEDWNCLADLSPEELEIIRRRCCEIGDRGEYFALQFEKKRLHKAGKSTLARKVDWVSRRAVGRGYDIRSYESNGSPRLIEVKSTTGRGMTFFMSNNEWSVAVRNKRAYHIYRVVDVEKNSKLKRIIQNPVAEEGLHKLERTVAGWKIKLV